MYKFDTSNDMWALTNKERHQNIEEAFVIGANYKDIELKDKTILIVDDIYTTGLQLKPSQRSLEHINLCKIDALTLASGSFYIKSVHLMVNA